MATKIVTIDSPIVLNPNDVTVDSSSIPSGSIAISKNSISANINGEITKFNASKYIILDPTSVKSESYEGSNRLDIFLTDDATDVLCTALKNAEANHNYLEVISRLSPSEDSFQFLLNYIIRFDAIVEEPNIAFAAIGIVKNYDKGALAIYECQLSIIILSETQKFGRLRFIKTPVIRETIFTIDGENENNVETGDSLVLYGEVTPNYDEYVLFPSSDTILKLAHTSGSGLFNNLRVFMYSYQTPEKTYIWQGTLFKDNDIYLAYIDLSSGGLSYKLKLERLKKSSEDVILGYMAIGLQDTASLKSFYFAGDDRKNSAVIASTTSSAFPGRGTGYFDVDLTDAMTREEYDKISYMTAQVSLIDNVSGTDYAPYHIQVNKAKSSTRYGIKVLILNNNLTAYSSIPSYGGCIITLYK